VTHNSLVASQRPHISLIDRRHFDYAALPIRAFEKRNDCSCEAEAIARPLTALSHLNVPHYRRALLLRAAGYMRLLERCPLASTVSFRW
jgi:hypothetical protein